MPTDDDYLEALREFAEELGKTPTRTEMNEDGPHSSTPYYNRWGSWNDALREAGLDPNHEYVPDDELLEDLRRLADDHGEPLRIEAVEEHGKYDHSTYFRRFESWFDALEKAGLESEYVLPDRRIDEDELIDALLERARELGRPPSQSEMNEGDGPSLTPYLTRWGSWGRALEAAGLGSRD